MLNSFVVKKFYRDIEDEELDYLEETLDNMRDAEIDIPDHVIDRMISREIISPLNMEISEDSFSAIPGVQDVIATLDDGIVYEVSNEAIGKSRNPFRIVLAREFESGYTMFVKIAPARNVDTLKVLDVWRRKGKIPLYPPQHSIRQFKSDWNVKEAIEAYLTTAIHRNAGGAGSRPEEGQDLVNV